MVQATQVARTTGLAITCKKSLYLRVEAALFLRSPCDTLKSSSRSFLSPSRYKHAPRTLLAATPQTPQHPATHYNPLRRLILPIEGTTPSAASELLPRPISKISSTNNVQIGKSRSARACWNAANPKQRSLHAAASFAVCGKVRPPVLTSVAPDFPSKNRSPIRLPISMGRATRFLLNI